MHITQQDGTTFRRIPAWIRRASQQQHEGADNYEGVFEPPSTYTFKHQRSAPQLCSTAASTPSARGPWATGKFGQATCLAQCDADTTELNTTDATPLATNP